MNRQTHRAENCARSQSYGSNSSVARLGSHIKGSHIKSSDINSGDKTVRWWGLLCLLITLAFASGCETIPSGPSQPEICGTQPNSSACLCAIDSSSADCLCSQSNGVACQCARNPSLRLCDECPAGSPRALTRDALSNIGQGYWDEAELQIRCALEADPQYKRAAAISVQLSRRRIGDTAGALDDRSSVPYTVLRGDQLGDIAQKCLNNPDKFVEIAVVNNISNPSRVRAGTKLRIPTTKPCVDCDELRSEALRAESQGDLVSAVSKIVEAKGVCRGNELIGDDYVRLRGAQIKALHDQAEGHLARGSTRDARNAWLRILELDGEDAKARFYLDRLEDE